MYTNQSVLIYDNHINLPVLDPADKEGFDKIFPSSEVNSHWHILASTRSGKSELLKLIYMKLYYDDCSTIICDPHGDLAMQCGGMMKGKEEFIYIDPTLKKGFTPTINPFRLQKQDELSITIVAQELITAFENILGTEFTPNMEALLTPLIYTLLRKGDSGVDELVRALDDENNEDIVTEALKSPIKAHRDFIRTQFNKGKFVKTKDALATKLQNFLNHPHFSNLITGTSTINLEKAINNNKIIIFRLPKGEMRKIFQPAVKLIMALIQGIVFKRNKLPRESRPITHLICDEYQNIFGQLSNEILSENAKNNLFIHGAHQYLSQLDTKSKDGLMSGANIKIVGKNSNKDLKIMAEEIEVDIQLLKELKQGEFYVKVASNPAIKITTTDKFLGYSNSGDKIRWKKHLKYQIKEYYKKIEDTSNIEEQVNLQTQKSPLPIPNFEIGE